MFRFLRDTMLVFLFGVMLIMCALWGLLIHSWVPVLIWGGVVLAFGWITRKDGHR